jgi:signal transduction histidine kinase
MIVPSITRMRSHIDFKDVVGEEILDSIEDNARSVGEAINKFDVFLEGTELQSVNVNSVLFEMTSKVREEWQEDPLRTTIRVTLDLDDSIPLLRAPVSQVSAIFYNIINNAYRAMESGGQLTVTSQHSGNEIRVRFQDTGCGIPHHVRERLFIGPIPPRGKGLTLWFSQLILQSIGGNLVVEKSDSTGTTMLVEISSR